METTPLIDTKQLITAEYQAANALYSSLPPMHGGRLVLSQDEARELPLALDAIYATALEAVAKTPHKATSWAQTFGKLSVCVALDGRDTQFALEDLKDGRYPPAPGRVAELQTTRARALDELFSVDTQRDGPLAFVLAEGEPQVAELALIKALHLIDFALVHRHIKADEAANYQPLILRADEQELVRLHANSPEAIRLRLYGNVRERADASLILGTVVATSMLEAAGAAVYEFGPPPSKPPQKPPDRELIQIAERPEATVVGITTAKRPHIGHAFLLARAHAEAGPGGLIIVEQNDLGPRVAQMVRAHAAKANLTFAEATKAITAGTVNMREIETAYRSRVSDGPAPVLPPEFALTAGNNYCAATLQAITTHALTMHTNSATLRELMPKLRAHPAATTVGGEQSGMTLVRGTNGDAAVIETAGQLTILGLFAAMNIQYRTTLVDHTPIADRPSQKALASVELETNSAPGLGLSINFETASGTKGDSVPIERLIAEAVSTGHTSQAVLTACRIMLQGAYFIGDQVSSRPNYASQAAVLEAFRAALTQVNDAGPGLLYRPLNPQPITKYLAEEVLARAMGNVPVAGKPTVATIFQLLKVFPQLVTPEEATYAILHQDTPELTIPKTTRQSDDVYWKKFLASNPAFVFGLLEEVADTDPQAAMTILEGTKLLTVMQGMGYQPAQLTEFLGKLKGVTNVYQLC